MTCNTGRIHVIEVLQELCVEFGLVIYRLPYSPFSVVHSKTRHLLMILVRYW